MRKAQWPNSYSSGFWIKPSEIKPWLRSLHCDLDNTPFTLQECHLTHNI